MTGGFTIRPYRSHRYPACSFCRNRKARCDFDLPNQPCRLCRARKRVCDYGGKEITLAVTSHDPGVSVEDGEIPSSDAATQPNKRHRLFHDSTVEQTLPASIPATMESSSALPSGTDVSPTESSLMMNPHMAEDITVLQQYLTSTTSTSQRNSLSKLYNTISTAPGVNPVVYLSLPKGRKGLKTAVDPGRAQREIIEHVLGNLASEVRKAYFDHLHPCFPVLDAKTFLEMWTADHERISPTLICDLYAAAQQVWNRSTVLCLQDRPDPHFIWNQAVTALRDDFMAPTISTVHAAVLDLLGRPVIGVTGNIVNAGRVVTLAQSLGLHRDPSSWKATAHEKNVRINLWWGVLIHDYWSSIGHGIPPTISPRYYDVPLPVTPDMIGLNTQSELPNQANDSFVQLCKLSQILGDILPLVYCLRETPEEIKRQLRKVECAMDDWLLQLPTSVRDNNGGSNLWFAHLSTKVLICRLSFKAATVDTAKQPEARQYQLAMLRDAAIEAAYFVTSLTEAQLQEFWMPYTSYLLNTAATILLRCTIEGSDLATKKTCITKLVAFRDRLRSARDTSRWDLAEFCLERCDESIQKVADAMGICPEQTSTETLSSDLGTTSSTGSYSTAVDTSNTSEFFIPIDSLDLPWETLWESMDGPWSIQI